MAELHPEGYTIYNGKLVRNFKPMIMPSNRSYRYGDGFFETMKMVQKKIMLESYHRERMIHAAQVLKFKNPLFFGTEGFWEEVHTVTRRNYIRKLARIRVTVTRGDGGLYDVDSYDTQYCIQAWDMSEYNNQLNSNGLIVGIYTDAVKTIDAFSSLKTNNFLCYSMAALWVKECKLNDALLLNQYGRITDSTIANIFIIKDGKITTPPISEGCISGVMRKNLLKVIKEKELPIDEAPLTIEALLEADEVFLTNVISGIRWVKQIDNKLYGNSITQSLYNSCIHPLFYCH